MERLKQLLEEEEEDQKKTMSTTVEESEFPKGLRVLAVDDNPVCLSLLKKMLLKCGYQVSVSQNAFFALELLREKKEKFDIVITDVHMPDMDGFRFMEIVHSEMHLPVVMLSVNGEVETVMKGVKHGACDYLLKPVRMEELKIIWKHVVRKSMNDKMDASASDSIEKSNDSTGIEDECRTMVVKSNRDYDDGNGAEEETSKKGKKVRISWTPELHDKFVSAVNQLGVSSNRATPKNILDLMETPHLTRQQVASHLQKYREGMKKKTKEMEQQSYNGFSLPSYAGFGNSAVNWNYPTSVPFVQTQNPCLMPSWTPPPSIHQNILRRVSFAEHGRPEMNSKAVLQSSAVQRLIAQANFNDLSRQSVMSRSYSLTGPVENSSQCSSSHHIIPMNRSLTDFDSSNVLKENHFNFDSQLGVLVDTYSPEFNDFLTDPNEKYSYGSSAGNDGLGDGIHLARLE